MIFLLCSCCKIWGYKFIPSLGLKNPNIRSRLVLITVSTKEHDVLEGRKYIYITNDTRVHSMSFNYT